jgi:hypothetical protein
VFNDILLRFPTSENGLNNSAGETELYFLSISLTVLLENTAAHGQNLEASHLLN